MTDKTVSRKPFKGASDIRANLARANEAQTQQRLLRLEELTEFNASRANGNTYRINDVERQQLYTIGMMLALVVVVALVKTRVLNLENAVFDA